MLSEKFLAGALLAMSLALVAGVTVAAPTVGLLADLVFTDGFEGDHTLSVEKTGSGVGTVTSSPAGIDCGADCFENYAPGSGVSLAAAAQAQSTFGGWGGACGGTISPCNVTMNAAKSASANFILTGSDPRNCGAPGLTCRFDQICSNSSCVCRPGLTQHPSGACVDTQSNPNACGNVFTTCPMATFCLNGTCTANGCGALANCGFACVRLESDPLNCGGCGNRCAVDEVCVAGNCDMVSY